ncbi:DUF2334 domain-containing protein [Anaerocellum diazotrophicum]|uniref:DUF2334 domain-containing protein n=1 Tax=Caldicellulosiruptor diazotrophicus TaxID=2806205 RepID=UPI001A9188E9|nr:DUF2334 domain-containing protein [Caldicellulosiruptor diazotrophicus]
MIRVDDFPRWDLGLGEFYEFHNIMVSNNVDYVIGLTPFLSFYEPKFNPIDENYIKAIKELNLNYALHGFNHYNYYESGKKLGEINYYSDIELENLLAKTYAFFQENELKLPDVFIPPFNALSKNNYNVLKKYFKIICEGPLTLSTMPELKPIMGVFIGESLYLPSYFPYYSVAKDIMRAIQRTKLKDKNLIIPITIHWAWEKSTNYLYLKELLELIKYDVLNWCELVTIVEEINAGVK